jgi:hypothetical protein
MREIQFRGRHRIEDYVQSVESEVRSATSGELLDSSEKELICLLKAHESSSRQDCLEGNPNKPENQSSGFVMPSV